MTIRALISIHDVMPETLDRVEHLFCHIQSFGHETITLLVVPGRQWQDADILRLQALVTQGAVLSGHGWHHQAKHIRGIKHRLHSLLISKDVAEHLALNKEELCTLVNDCYQWFGQYQLPTPELYVPPAWAMGALNTTDLEQLPFQQYETLQGVYDAQQHRFISNPMIGFEARDRWRVPFIRLWNGINFRRARKGAMIRIGIHPDDHLLPMHKDMDFYLQQVTHAEKYSALSSIKA